VNLSRSFPSPFPLFSSTVVLEYLFFSMTPPTPLRASSAFFFGLLITIAQAPPWWGPLPPFFFYFPRTPFPPFPPYIPLPSNFSPPKKEFSCLKSFLFSPLGTNLVGTATQTSPPLMFSSWAPPRRSPSPSCVPLYWGVDATPPRLRSPS